MTGEQQEQNSKTSKANERLKLRGKIVTQGRTAINKKIRNGTYIEFLLKENGVLNEEEVITDRDFLNDIISEIERNRTKSLVYNDKYKRQYLDEWIEIRDRKERKKRIADKIKTAIDDKKNKDIEQKLEI